MSTRLYSHRGWYFSTSFEGDHQSVQRPGWFLSPIHQDALSPAAVHHFVQKKCGDSLRNINGDRFEDVDGVKEYLYEGKEDGVGNRY